MLVSKKEQVTIPKDIRTAAGVLPGSEVSFSLDGGKIVITPAASRVRNDRRDRLRAAAAKVRATLRRDQGSAGASGYTDRGERPAYRRPRPKRRSGANDAQHPRIPTRNSAFGRRLGARGLKFRDVSAVVTPSSCARLGDVARGRQVLEVPIL